MIVRALIIIFPYHSLLNTVSANASSAECSTCRAGKFFVSTVSACKHCADGYIQLSNISVNAQCQACAQGFVFHGSATKPCYECPAGYLYFGGTSGSASTPECIKCPPGQYQDQTYTLRLPENRDCKYCEIKTYQNDEGGTDCKYCPIVNKIGEFRCMGGCKAGTFGFCTSPQCEGLEGNETIDAYEGCETCPTGWFAPQGDKPGCSFCPKGYYADRNSSENCKACLSGLYGTEAFAKSDDVCHPCPPGRQK